MDASVAPAFFFVHSTPQHFFPEGNGYYQRTFNGTTCASYSNATLAFELDWRNRLADEVLGSHPNITVVVLDALYSQWDAHIGHHRLSWLSYADCTHWCVPGGQLQYIVRMIYNALVRSTAVEAPINILSNPLYETYKDNTLVKGSGKATYLVVNNTKHMFGSLQKFMSMGFDLSDVRTIPDFEIAEIPEVSDEVISLWLFIKKAVCFALLLLALCIDPSLVLNLRRDPSCNKPCSN